MGSLAHLSVTAIRSPHFLLSVNAKDLYHLSVHLRRRRKIMKMLMEMKVNTTTWTLNTGNVLPLSCLPLSIIFSSAGTDRILLVVSPTNGRDVIPPIMMVKLSPALSQKPSRFTKVKVVQKQKTTMTLRKKCLPLRSVSIGA